MMPSPRAVWPKGILLLLLVCAAGSFAADDRPNDTAGRTQVAQDDGNHAERLLAYLQTPYDNHITRVLVDARQIRIEGTLREPPAKLQLVEVPMWDDVTTLKSPATVLPIDSNDPHHFTTTVPRTTKDGRDRLLSAWAIMRQSGGQLELASAMHYADSETARADLPRAKPRSIKGLGGCPFDSPDMEALGVASVTLNIVLNEIITSAPGPGTTPYLYGGKQWYTRDGVVAGYDRDMKIAFEHAWMVSAILLIRPAGNSPAGSWVRDAACPDADPPGVFVMPNFTTRAGVEAYAAVLNFLAERYSRPDGKFGRIHDWIMHNEISSGFYWTNAGRKTLITYLDLYQKSMRTMYLIARQYDPHAKPLISLDHCWTFRGDPRAYAGRELLDRLVDFGRTEGDFEWGIAFHPYAQDLFNPRTWEDPEARFDFNTPFITFRNLEVLDAWVRQPRVLYHGADTREIQLTEEGLNSRDYSEKALAEQAAGLAYAWEKIQPLKTITAFQYHHWADAAEEGGLRLGLRKLGQDPHDPLGKKPIWDIFRAMGTGDWPKASESARTLIGIKDWSEVRRTGKIE